MLLLPLHMHCSPAPAPVLRCCGGSPYIHTFGFLFALFLVLLLLTGYTPSPHSSSQWASTVRLDAAAEPLSTWQQSVPITARRGVPFTEYQPNVRLVVSASHRLGGSLRQASVLRAHATPGGIIPRQAMPVHTVRHPPTDTNISGGPSIDLEQALIPIEEARERRWTAPHVPRRAALGSVAVTIGALLSRKSEAGAVPLTLRDGIPTIPYPAPTSAPKKSLFLERIQELQCPNQMSSYEPGFIVYLAGFLINFDNEFKRAWTVQSLSFRYRRTPLFKSVFTQIKYRQLAKYIENQIEFVPAQQVRCSGMF